MRTMTIVSLALLFTIGCKTYDDTGMSRSESSMAMPPQSIAEVAMSTGMHNTLVTALKAAGLADMLMQPGTYTVFAPTDEAFRRLPSGTVESLLRPENREKLRAILQYHVVPGRVTAQQVMGMSSAKSASGQTLMISTMGNTVMIGNATVVKADVPASNGIIHVIDTVLIPPGVM